MIVRKHAENIYESLLLYVIAGIDNTTDLPETEKVEFNEAISFKTDRYKDVSTMSQFSSTVTDTITQMLVDRLNLFFGAYSNEVNNLVADIIGVIPLVSRCKNKEALVRIIWYHLSRTRDDLLYQQ